MKSFKNITIDLIDHHILKFWFVRGVLLAISTLTLVTNVTEIEKLDFLRFIHALIFSWNNFLEIFGRIIGMLPIIPDVSASIMNIWVLSVVIGTGAFERIHKMIVRFREGILPEDDTLFFERPELRNRRYLIESLSAVFLPFFMLVGIYFGFRVVLLSPLLIESLVLQLLISLVFMASIPTVFAFLFFSIQDLLSLIMRHKAYKAGILCVLGLLLGFEILYILNLPYISDSMHQFSDSVLGARN